MKKIFFFLFPFLLFANVGFINHSDMRKILTTDPNKLPHTIKWLNDYKKAFNIAKKEHKLIMVHISKEYCPPCEYMFDIVYQDKKIADYINKHFIPLFYVVEKDKIPFEITQYFNEVAPSILFITPNGKLFFKIVGAREKKDFFKIIKNIESRYK